MFFTCFLAIIVVSNAYFHVDCGSSDDTYSKESIEDARIVGNTTVGRVGKNVTAPLIAGMYSTYREAKEKEDEWGYDVFVPPGFYNLTLHFAETAYPEYGAGKRRFGIKVQGIERERAFDVYKAAGNHSYVPVTVTYFVSVRSNALRFRLKRVDGIPALCGFDIIRNRREEVITPYKVNVGSNFSVDGFKPDPSDYRLNDGKLVKSNTKDLGTLYKTARSGAVKYRFPVRENQRYDVTLHFAELESWFRFPDARLFGVEVNDRRVRDLDIYSTAGTLSMTYTFKSVLADEGRIDVRLHHQAAEPILNAIQIDDEGSDFPSGTSVATLAMNVGGYSTLGYSTDNTTMYANVTDTNRTRASWVSGTSAPGVYATRRESNHTISMSLPASDTENATYTVDLLFAETTYSSSNERVMDIYLNGRKRSTVDVYYDYGPKTAAKFKRGRIRPTENGTIDVDVVPTNGSAMLSGVVLHKDLHDAPAPSWRLLEVNDTSPMLKRHENCVAVYNGTFYLIGGRRLQYVSTYTPATDAWGYAAMPPIEIHHVQCVLVRDRILIGMAFTGEYPHEEVIDRLLWYHPRNDSWTWGATIPPARNRGSAATIERNGMVYFMNGNVGGHGAHSTSENWFDSYDVENDSWEVLPDTPHARDHGMAAIAADRIIVIGGRNGGVDDFFNATINAVDVWDFETERWMTAEQTLPDPSGGALVGALDNRVVVAGGEGFNEIWGRTVIFDPTTMKFVDLDQGSMQTPRHGTQLVKCGEALYAPGGAGWQGGGPELDSIEVFTMDGKPPKTCVGEEER